MLYRLIATVAKLLAVSLLVGAALAAVGLGPEDILRDAGLSPQDVREGARRAVAWAVPHILLGLLATLPIWLTVYVLRPPRGD